MAAPGIEKQQALREAGFNESEISQWQRQTKQDLANAGFSDHESDEYFGIKIPDMAPVKGIIDENLTKVREATPASEMKVDSTSKPPEAADTFLKAVEAGFEISTAGLFVRGQKPDILLPENAPMFYRIASQAATMAGDLPAMMAGIGLGGAAGGAAGAVGGTFTLPVVGTIGGATAGATVGAGAGAFALPAALRTAMMQHYEKGNVKDFSDFWERASAVFLDSLKQGTIGAATAGIGGPVAKLLGPVASPAVQTVASKAAEVATMVSVGKAIEGKVPEPQDFLDAAVLVGGFHIAGSAVENVGPAAKAVESKLRDIYAKTGIKPTEVVDAAQVNPTIKQDLLSSNVDIPKALEGAVEGASSESTKTVTLDPGQKSSVLSEDTKPNGMEVEVPKAETKSAEEPIGSLRTEAEKVVLERIKGSDNSKPPMTWDKFYTNAIDDLHPIKLMTDELTGGKPLPVEKNPYALMRLSRGSYGKADQFLEHAPFEFKTLENIEGVKPFKEIVEPFKEDLQGLNAYMVAARSVELADRGIESGVPLDAAKQIVADGKSKYADAFKEMVKYQNSTLAYLRDSGILSKEAYASMTDANKSYVPFFRLQDENVSDGKSAGKGLRVNNPIKGIEGSERTIIDPLESIIKNTYLYVTLAERNRALSSLVQLAEKSTAGPEMMVRVKTPMKPIEVQKEEVAKFMEEHGIEGNPDSFNIFRPQSQPLAPDQIALFRDGKREVYQVSQDIATTIKGLDRESSNFLMKYMSLPAKFLRVGAVHTPDFLARHMIRDQVNALNLSKSGYIPIGDMMRGLGSVLKEDENYQNWLKSGGAISSMVSIDRDYIQNNIFKLSKETGLIDSAWNVIKSPLALMQVGAELMSNSTRVGEFMRSTKGNTSPEALLKGGLDSRDVTLDYQRIGAQTRALNSITAFWNAHVQGLDRMARAFKDDPVGMGVKIAASITMPSVLLWFANHEDERYKELPRWEKDLCWIVLTKDHVFRIPKPFEPGVIFGSLPERLLEAFYDHNPKGFKGFSDSVLAGAIPSYIPTFASPVIEQFANKSTMTGGPIVPDALEKVLPQYQYNEYTTETGKMLGKLVAAVPNMRESKAASPMILENYIRAWSGNLGKYALQLADQALVKSGAVDTPVEKPTATLADIPFIKAFVIRYPSATTASIQDFNERYKESKTVIDTIRHLAKTQDFVSMQKEVMLTENQDKLVKLDGIHESISTQGKFVHMVYQNPALKSDEKRQLIDGVYNTMIQEAQMGNKLMEQLEKTFVKH